MNIRNYFIFFPVILVLLYSCASEDNKEIQKVDTQKIEVNKTTSKPDAQQQSNVAFRIPSPVELYIFMNELEVPFDKELLSDVEKVENYYTLKEKAVNFGVYASDLAYCTVYMMSQETYHYFKAAKTLADKLNVSEGFDEIVSQRLNANMNNTDSLYEISGDAYADACNYLESSGKEDVKAMILYGSWIESCHISINSVKTFSAEDELVLRIAEQQYLLETLYEYYEYLNIPAVNELKEKLIPVKDVFDSLYDNTEEVITKNQFNAISVEIEKLRAEIVS